MSPRRFEAGDHRVDLRRGARGLVVRMKSSVGECRKPSTAADSGRPTRSASSFGVIPCCFAARSIFWPVLVGAGEEAHVEAAEALARAIVSATTVV